MEVRAVRSVQTWLSAWQLSCLGQGIRHHPPQMHRAYYPDQFTRANATGNFVTGSGLPIDSTKQLRMSAVDITAAIKPRSLTNASLYLITAD